MAGRGERVHLVGNSLGGLVALSVAARRPELVETLTLISPAVPDLRPDPRRILDPRLLLAAIPGPVGRPARRALRAMTSLERAEHTVDLVFGDPAAVPEHRLREAAEEIEERVRMSWAREAQDETGRALVRSWLLGPSPWPLAARVTAPTLVLWGDQDRLVSPGLAPRTAAALHGRLVMLPGVGHVGQMEAPETVAAEVARLWADAAGKKS